MTHHHHGNATHSHLATLDPSVEATGHVENHSDLGEHDCLKYQQVCDDCLTVAYDEGYEESQAQKQMMITLGVELPDHNCEAKESPEFWAGGCACGCNERSIEDGT